MQVCLVPAWRTVSAMQAPRSIFVLLTAAFALSACNPRGDDAASGMKRGKKGEFVRVACLASSKTLGIPQSDSNAFMGAIREVSKTMPEDHPDVEFFENIASTPVDASLEFQRKYAEDAGLTQACGDWFEIGEARVISADIYALPHRATERGDGFEVDVPKGWRRTDRGVETIAKRFGLVLTDNLRFSRDVPVAWAMRAIDAAPDDCEAHMQAAGEALGFGRPSSVTTGRCEAHFDLGRGNGATLEVGEASGRVVESLCQWSTGDSLGTRQDQCFTLAYEARWDALPVVARKPNPSRPRFSVPDCSIEGYSKEANALVGRIARSRTLEVSACVAGVATWPELESVTLDIEIAADGTTKVTQATTVPEAVGLGACTPESFAWTSLEPAGGTAVTGTCTYRMLGR